MNQTDTQLAPGPVDTTRSPHARLRTLPFASVSLLDGFWAKRQAVNRAVGLAHGYRMLDEAGNLRDLRLAAGMAQGEYRGLRFMDSDVYKWLEAVAFELARGPDGHLERMAEQVIDLVTAAQAPDGYLNTYYQVTKPGERWTNLRDDHELYAAGHLFQAAVAHHRATGRTELLAVARRFADLIAGLFGAGKREGTPGHPEIEMALVEFYRDSGDPGYLELAAYFVDQRGHGIIGGGSYHQDQVPIREAETLEGHAVRQLYLTAGVTDLYLETGERALLDAVLRQWDDLAAHKLSITGGVGARHEGEAFGDSYELPNDRCYCETCAAIASIMWNWRLLLATGERRFADLIERTLFNGFLSGLAHDGQRYFYVNPLLSRVGTARPEWYGCACCPPNVMRLLASLGHYIATSDQAGLQIHQYAPARIDTGLETAGRVALRLETGYPWQGDVRLTIEEPGAAPWALSLRLPGWCEAPSLRVNGEPATPEAGSGYALLERAWRGGDVVELSLTMPPRLTVAHPQVDAARASAAIERGPLVYCLEQCDQEAGVDVLDVEIDESAPLEAVWREELLGGMTVVEPGGLAVDNQAWDGRLYASLGRSPDVSRRPVQLVAVPYYAWANRDPGAMRVWIPRHMP